jgi:hypothetical protein
MRYDIYLHQTENAWSGSAGARNQTDSQREREGEGCVRGASSACAEQPDQIDTMALLCDTLALLHHRDFEKLLFITAAPNTKLCAWGEEDSGGHVL